MSIFSVPQVDDDDVSPQVADRQRRITEAEREAHRQERAAMVRNFAETGAAEQARIRAEADATWSGFTGTKSVSAERLRGLFEPRPRPAELVDYRQGLRDQLASAEAGLAEIEAEMEAAASLDEARKVRDANRDRREELELVVRFLPREIEALGRDGRQHAQLVDDARKAALRCAEAEGAIATLDALTEVLPAETLATWRSALDLARSRSVELNTISAAYPGHRKRGPEWQLLDLLTPAVLAEWREVAQVAADTERQAWEAAWEALVRFEATDETALARIQAATETEDEDEDEDASGG